jgi:hypothetical protein
MVKNLMEGLTKKAASSSDASTKLPGKNIDSDSTRSATAKTPPSLGPRTA